MTRAIPFARNARPTTLMEFRNAFPKTLSLSFPLSVAGRSRFQREKYACSKRLEASGGTAPLDGFDGWSRSFESIRIHVDVYLRRSFSGMNLFLEETGATCRGTGSICDGSRVKDSGSEVVEASHHSSCSVRGIFGSLTLNEWDEGQWSTVEEKETHPRKPHPPPLWRETS